MLMSSRIKGAKYLVLCTTIQEAIDLAIDIGDQADCIAVCEDQYTHYAYADYFVSAPLALHACQHLNIRKQLEQACNYLDNYQVRGQGIHAGTVSDGGTYAGDSHA